MDTFESVEFGSGIGKFGIERAFGAGVLGESVASGIKSSGEVRRRLAEPMRT